MPCIGFTCKRGPEVLFDECIEKCEDRCISRRTATIFKSMNTRNLKTFSVTQLIAPTRIQALMILNKYFEEPEAMVARSIGQLGHTMTDVEIEDALSEERLSLNVDGEDLEVSGKFDSYEDGELWDLKVVGAYKIARAKGDIRQLHDYIIQQNFYRMMIEYNLKFDT